MENRHQPPDSLPTRPLSGLPPMPTSPPSLSSADFVFIKREVPGPPFSPLYDGPYWVQSCGPKVFDSGTQRQTRTSDSGSPQAVPTYRGGSCDLPYLGPPTLDFSFIALPSGLHSGGGGPCGGPESDNLEVEKSGE